MFSLARRPNGRVDAMGYLKVPEFGDELFTLLEYPGALLQQTQAQQEDLTSFSVGGLALTPLEPMKKWRIQYNGKMKSVANGSKVVDVQIDGLWTYKHSPFDFSTDISVTAMSEAVAGEQWSRQYFDDLKT